MINIIKFFILNLTIACLIIKQDSKVYFPIYYLICFIEIENDLTYYNINELENCILTLMVSQGLGLKIIYYWLINYIHKFRYYVVLETQSSNSKSLSLYYYYNFQIIFSRKKYYKHSSENCLIMFNTTISSRNFFRIIVLICSREQTDYEINTTEAI
nr:hypothetical protein [Pseudoerythrocladia kornmannii]